MLQIDWQGPRVSQIGVFFIGHAYGLQAICYLLMRTSPKHYVGKDCQHTRILELAAHAGQCRIHVRCSVRAGYLLWRVLVSYKIKNIGSIIIGTLSNILSWLQRIQHRRGLYLKIQTTTTLKGHHLQSRPSYRNLTCEMRHHHA